MGQEKYEKVLDVINRQLKAESNPAINDESPITENQGALLKKALLKLTGMNEATMYPDGLISPEAKIKLGNIDVKSIENALLETPKPEDAKPTVPA